MNALIEQHRESIEDLCRRYHVRRLELFGSATREDFKVAESDLDFLVEYLPLNPGQHADAYFGLLAALEDVFQRPIDLVMTRAIKNRFFLEAVNKTRTELYAA